VTSQDQVPYRRPEERPEGGLYSSVTQQAAARGIGRMLRENPNLGPAVEDMIQKYPMISRDTVTGLVMSGQAGNVSPALLDRLAEHDRIAMEKAEQQNIWQRGYAAAKWVSRNFQMAADDVYNSSALFTAPRMAINRSQGRSWGESWDRSSNSTLRNQILMERLGFKTDYGEGWLPNEDLVITDPFYFANVKAKILNGEFEGSTEEQLIAAANGALLEQGMEKGFNWYALARQQWQSTHMHRTIGGIDYSVPYSPGAAVALLFTTPGTRSYDVFSGLMDSVSRMKFEPIDLVTDYAGDMIRHFVNPLVRGGAPGFRTRAFADVLHEPESPQAALPAGEAD
jgi:hypothetical protein